MNPQDRIKQLEQQLDTQARTISAYHILEEQWRKDRLKLERINEELLRLPERFREIIDRGHAEK
jgi:uncharacterized coiled-coil protein SlyX